MKILNHVVTFESMTPDALELIMRMGKKCWQSEPTKSPEEFTKMLIRRGHESVLEHASMTVSIMTDRGITHEIVRHRIGCSYSQESTRYVKYDDMEVMTQGEECDQDPSFLCVLEHAEREYGFLIDKGFKPQIARSVLPNALKADIGMTANFRAWRHFLRLRLSPYAHPSIRNVARAIWCMLPDAVVSDICAGCGCKPYKWSELTDNVQKASHGIIDVRSLDIEWSNNQNIAPPEWCFPLCKCKE